MDEVIFIPEGHRYVMRGVEYPSVTTILTHFGISTFEDVKKYIGDDLLSASQIFGDNFHKTTALYDQENLEYYDNEIEPWLAGWIKLRKDLKPEFITIELPMVSEKWGFAGTPDRIVEVNKTTSVWDLKSGNKQTAHELQTAAYKLLAEEYCGNKIKDRASILIKRNSYKIIPHTGINDEGIFKGLINAWHWKKKKGLI